jgi:putative FmdB family regulatory protein
MALYEYTHVEPPEECADFEIFQKMSDDPLTTCPECGKKVRKVISVPRMKVTRRGQKPGDSVKRYLKEDRPHHIVPYDGKKIVFKGPKSDWDNQAYRHYLKHKPELKRTDFKLINK